MKFTKLLIILLLPLSLFAQEEKRLALVIGNANYDKGELKNPVNDARLIASTLDSLDFDVILKENLESQTDFKRAILEFGKKRPEYDIAFVYYAGHGVQISGENYLLPTKVEFSGEDEVEMFGVSVQDIMRYLKSQTNEVNILILDACRDNPFESNWNTTRSLKGGGLAKIPPPTGSLIAFSTDSGQTAPDGDGENSIYSTSLAKNMLLEDTSIDQVFRNVRAEVLAETKGAQRPVEATQLTGQTFYLAMGDFTKFLPKIDKLINEKKNFEALDLATSLIEKDLNNSIWYKKRAEIYSSLNQFDKMLDDYLNCLTLNPNSSEYYFLIAKSYYELYHKEKKERYGVKHSSYKMNGKAIEYFKKCIDENCNPEAFKFLGLLYFEYSVKSEERSLAKEYLIQYNKLRPNDPHGNYLMSFTEVDNNKQIEFLKKSIELEEKKSSGFRFKNGADVISSAYKKLAETYRNTGSLNKAYQALNQSIEFNSENLYAYFYKMLFLISVNEGFPIKKLKSEDFNYTLSKVISLGREKPVIVSGIVNYYRKIGDFKNALKFNNQTILLEPDNVDHKYTKATILYRMNDYEESLKLLLPMESAYGKSNSSDLFSGVKSLISLCYMDIGSTFFDKNEFQKAKSNLLKAFDYNDLIFKRIDEIKFEKQKRYYVHRANISRHLMSTYLAIGDQKKKDKFNLTTLKAYNDLTDKYPKYFAGFYSEATYHYFKKDYNSAKESLKESLLLNPKFDTSHYLLAIINYEEEEFNLSLDNINKALDYMSYSKMGYFMLKLSILINLNRNNEYLSTIVDMENFYINNKEYYDNVNPNRGLEVLFYRAYINYSLGNILESVMDLSELIKGLNNHMDNGVQIYINNTPTIRTINKMSIDKFPNHELFLLNEDPDLGLNKEEYFLKIRGDLYRELGLKDYMCKDYSRLEFFQPNSEMSKEIEDLIKVNCN